MDFQLDDKRLALQKAVRDFAEKELLPGVRERDETSTFPVDAYKKMGEMGLIGLPYPKEYGGQGGDYLDYAIAVEEIAKVDGSVAISYSVSTSLYGGSVSNSASEEQKKAFLPPVLSGKSFGAFGLTEPNAGSDAGGCITTATREGDHYILNGAKCFNTNGPLADYFAVYALTEPEKKAKGLSCFLVKKGTPGFSIGKIEDKMGIRAAQVSELIFDNCKIPAENLMGEEGQGFKVAMKTLDGGRIGVAAQGLGLAEGAFEIARKYLMQREQFGKPLYKNQYLAFKMVELECQIEQARLMLYKAALDKTEGRPYTLSAAKAKLLCTDAAMHVTTEAVQMLGGNGYMKDYHVERMMRDAKITQIYEGTNEIQKLVISGQLFR
ncbi:acyl-CoA dehydrogenase family protein [Eubacterium sp. 1001713B170207_170306_E7]|uniref:acyl-CoA dehydrogenase family protein n=1 Tax=Eubacterium sp. 1001713B170207_170306_E7 TaxID=2787097 RepID=UPI001898A002|nr:acyl-CoA dehydrogenase family protein [Eubacterium sp. 1001713B170207_170306_E7]